MLQNFLMTFTGALIALATSTLLKLVIEPILSVRSCIGRLASLMRQHCALYQMGWSTFVQLGGTPEANVKNSDLFLKMDAEMRKGMGDVIGTVYAAPFYAFWAWIGFVPTKEQIQEGLAQLTGLLNGIGSVLPEDERNRFIKRFNIDAVTRDQLVRQLLLIDKKSCWDSSESRTTANRF